MMWSGWPGTARPWRWIRLPLGRYTLAERSPIDAFFVDKSNQVLIRVLPGEHLSVLVCIRSGREGLPSRAGCSADGRWLFLAILPENTCRCECTIHGSPGRTNPAPTGGLGG